MFGFPKFMASIDFDETEQWLSCEVREENDLLLRLKGRKIPTTRSDEMRMFAHVYLDSQPQCLEFRMNVREYGMSMKRSDAELELGTHPVADELKNVLLSTRPLMYMNTARAQGMLFGPETLSVSMVERYITARAPAEAGEFASVYPGEAK